MAGLGNIGAGLRNLLFGGVIMNLLQGQFQPNQGRGITGSATAGPQRQRPTRGQVGAGPPGMEMPQPSRPGQQNDQQASFRQFGPHGPTGRPVRQLPAHPSVETPGTGIADFTGPVNPSLSQRTGPRPGEGRIPHSATPGQPVTPQDLEQFTFPGGNVLKFTTGSSPALALTALVDTIAGAGAGAGLTAADLYGVIGAAPEDPDSFMQALTLRWQEAMAASFGDPKAASTIFSNSLVTEATPVQEALTLEELLEREGLDFGGEPSPVAAAEEFDPADFTIDPSLLYSSETSGEDFF